MTVAAGKPTRAEALKYYRRAVEHFELEVRQYERVERVTGHDGAFIVHTVDSEGAAAEISHEENCSRHGILRSSEFSGCAR